MNEPDDPFRRAVSTYAAAIGVAAPSDEEMDRLLELAKAAADGSGERRAAPITCYLAGMLLAGEADAGSRAARVADITRTLPDVS